MAGTVGGMAGICVSQPFDVIKVRIQAGSTAAPAASSASQSVWSALRMSLRTEGEPRRFNPRIIGATALT